MKKLLLLTIVCLASCIFLAGGAWGAVFCVNDAAGLQTALNTAKSNGTDDTIKVVQGTSYTGPFTFTSTEGYNITLQGGYVAGCASRVVNPANTILDGNGTGDALYLYNYTTTGVASGYIIVDGFTLQHGGGGALGGGVHAESKNMSTTSNMNAGSVTISNNIITGNTATTSGGGVYADSVSYHGSSGIVTVSKNIITGNTATTTYAGGVYARSYAPEGTAASVILTNNIIAENTSGTIGGGVYANSDSLTAANTITLTNNTITGNNSSSSVGGGLWVSANSADGIINVYNNIIRGNTATSGDDIYFGGITGTTNGYNNDYHEINTSWTNSGGNIDTDPLFEDASVSDYHLSATSPCFGAGDGNAPSAPTTDFEGDSRTHSVGTLDMGADEYKCENYPFKIGATAYNYTSIQNAYVLMSTGDTLLIHSLENTGDLAFNTNKAVTLKGGYGCRYSSNPGYTRVKGSLTISGTGKVTVENIKIK